MNNELFGKIEETGQWWLDPWWENRNFLGAERYPLNQLQEAAEILKEMFPAEWAKQLFANPQQNAIMPILIGHSAGALSAFHRLGLVGKHAKDLSGFASVLRRLKWEDSDSAFFELEMAASFSEKGVRTEFIRPSSEKSPDIVAHCSDIVVEIECKRLQEEAWALRHDDLTRAILFDAAHVSQPYGVDWQIKLNERISEIFLDDEKYPGFNDAVIQGIAGKIKSIVNNTVQSKELPLEFEVPGLMTGRALPKGDPGGSYISGASISSIAKLRRIFTNGILRGIRQLSGKMPGVLCIYSDYLPEPELMRTILDSLTSESNQRLKQQFAPMSALLLFPRQTMFEYTAPNLFENRTASFPFSQLEAAQIVKSTFSPIVA